MPEISESLQKIHEDSCLKGKLFYSDPETGARVFTKLFHLQRGSCCGNICRHCPFDHQNVPADICANSQIRRSCNQ